SAIPPLVERGLKVKLACPLMTENLLSYRGVMKLAEDLGVPYMLDLTITPMMDGSQGTLAHRVPSSALLPVLQDPVLTGCDVRSAAEENAEPALQLASAVSSGLESSVYDDLPCSAGHNSCYISPYGDVLPCVQLPKAAGNLRRQRFAEIWYRSPALEEV